MRIVWSPCAHETSLHADQHDEAKRLIARGCPGCPQGEARMATTGEIVRDPSDDPIFNEPAEVIRAKIAQLKKRLAEVSPKSVPPAEAVKPAEVKGIDTL